MAEEKEARPGRDGLGDAAQNLLVGICGTEVEDLQANTVAAGQQVCRDEHGAVLKAEGDDFVSLPPVEAIHDKVQAVGGALGKDDFLGCYVEEGCRPLPGFLLDLPTALVYGRAGGAVVAFVLHAVCHRLHDGLGGRAIPTRVQVDHLLASRNLFSNPLDVHLSTPSQISGPMIALGQGKGEDKGVYGPAMLRYVWSCFKMEKLIYCRAALWETGRAEKS